MKKVGDELNEFYVTILFGDVNIIGGLKILNDLERRISRGNYRG